MHFYKVKSEEGMFKEKLDDPAACQAASETQLKNAEVGICLAG